jgi:hypothetical protein
MQPLTVFTVHLLYTVNEKGGKPYRLPYGLRNPNRNLKSENSQDYAQKPNSAKLYVHEFDFHLPHHQMANTQFTCGVFFRCFIPVE